MAPEGAANNRGHRTDLGEPFSWAYPLKLAGVPPIALGVGNGDDKY